MLSHARMGPRISSCKAVWIQEGQYFQVAASSRIVCVATAPAAFLSLCCHFLFLDRLWNRKASQREREEGKTWSFQRCSDICAVHNDKFSHLYWRFSRPWNWPQLQDTGWVTDWVTARKLMTLWPLKRPQYCGRVYNIHSVILQWADRGLFYCILLRFKPL